MVLLVGVRPERFSWEQHGAAAEQLVGKTRTGERKGKKSEEEGKGKKGKGKAAMFIRIFNYSNGVLGGFIFNEVNI